MKAISEIIYNKEKQSLTIIFKDGSMLGYIGKLAIIKFNQLNN